MRLRNIISLLLAVTLIFLCGCAHHDTITLNKDHAPVNYTASYLVTTKSSKSSDGTLKYNNVYTVSLDGEKNELVISSLADEHWDNQKEDDDYLEGRQVIKTLSRLQYNDADGITFGMPKYIEQEFLIDVDKSYYTHFSFENDHNLNVGYLRTKEYSQSSESGFKEEVFSVSLTDCFYDKDSLPFIIAAFPESSGVIEVSSGNRNSLQTVKYEFMADEAVETSAGTFHCRVVRIRPNTNFSVNSARIYFDTLTGIPVKVTQDASTMILTSFSFN